MKIIKNWSIWRFMLFSSVLLLLCSLSYWQYQRGSAKAARLTLSSQFDQEYHELTAFDLKDRLPEFMPIKMQGCFSPDDTYLLDNQVYEGRIGYSVFTLFTPAPCTNTAQGFLVYRGFIPLSENRTVQPTIETPSAPFLIQGTVRYFSKAFTLGDWTLEFAHAPFRIQSLDLIKIFSQKTMQVAPWTLALAPHHPAAFEIVAQSYYLTPDKHYGYAVQWALLALTWVVLFGVFHIKGHHL